MSELRNISQEELNKILKLHELWLDTNGEEGKCADLSNADLRGANLRCSDLRYANLSCSNLRYAYLTDADLSNACLNYANLSGAYLIGTNLTGTDLSGVDLNGADLRDADLRDADLRYANLNKADLNDAKLSNVKYNYLTSYFALQCPEKGSFIGYKKSGNKIVELLIMEDSLRSSATSKKCRASHVKVLSITSLDGKEEFDKCENTGTYRQTYVKGAEILIEDFDTDRWNECSTGIHFFMTRDEAVNYK